MPKKITDKEIKDLVNDFRSGILFFVTGVGKVIIKILQSVRSFFLFVNKILSKFFLLIFISLLLS